MCIIYVRISIEIYLLSVYIILVYRIQYIHSATIMYYINYCYYSVSLLSTLQARIRIPSVPMPSQRIRKEILPCLHYYRYTYSIECSHRYVSRTCMS